MLKLLLEKNLKRLALLAFLVATLFIISQFLFPVDAGITNVPDPTQCDNLANADGNCAPPTLKLVEIWAIKALYLIWAFGGLMFGLGLFVIGISRMASGGEQQKLEELKKKATYWAISIPVFFGGYPVILFIPTVLPLNTSEDCFSQLDQPAFQVIFPNACRLGAGDGEDGIVGGCCNDNSQCFPGETCSVSNGACPVSGLSCQTQTVNPSNVDFGTTTNATYKCNALSAGRTLRLSPNLAQNNGRTLCAAAVCDSGATAYRATSCQQR